MAPFGLIAHRSPEEKLIVRDGSVRCRLTGGSPAAHWGV